MNMIFQSKIMIMKKHPHSAQRSTFNTNVSKKTHHRRKSYKVLPTLQKGLIYLITAWLHVSKNIFALWFYVFFFFFMLLYMYTAPGQGQTTLGDKILMSTERPYHFGHLLQSSKTSLQPLILYTFFHDFIHVYSPGARADNPLGTTFWCIRRALSL